MEPFEAAKDYTVRDVAVCITGQADRSASALSSTLASLATVFEPTNEFSGLTNDHFAYVSTFGSCPNDIDWMARQAFNFSVMYNDKKLNMPHTFNLENFGLLPRSSLNNWLQQHYGLQRCLEMVNDFSFRHKVKYRSLFRIRTDHVVKGNVSLIRESLMSNTDVHVPQGDDYGGLNDRMAWGAFEHMSVYMSRFEQMAAFTPHKFSTVNFHAETFLQYTLDQANIPVSRINISYEELPEVACT